MIRFEMKGDRSAGISTVGSAIKNAISRTLSGSVCTPSSSFSSSPPPPLPPPRRLSSSTSAHANSDITIVSTTQSSTALSNITSLHCNTRSRKQKCDIALRNNEADNHSFENNSNQQPQQDHQSAGGSPDAAHKNQTPLLAPSSRFLPYPSYYHYYRRSFCRPHSFSSTSFSRAYYDVDFVSNNGTSCAPRELVVTSAAVPPSSPKSQPHQRCTRMYYEHHDDSFAFGDDDIYVDDREKQAKDLRHCPKKSSRHHCQQTHSAQSRLTATGTVFGQVVCTCTEGRERHVLRSADKGGAHCEAQVPFLPFGNATFLPAPLPQTGSDSPPDPTGHNRNRGEYLPHDDAERTLSVRHSENLRPCVYMYQNECTSLSKVGFDLNESQERKFSKSGVQQLTFGNENNSNNNNTDSSYSSCSSLVSLFLPPPIVMFKNAGIGDKHARNREKQSTQTRTGGQHSVSECATFACIDDVPQQEFVKHDESEREEGAMEEAEAEEMSVFGISECAKGHVVHILKVSGLLSDDELPLEGESARVEDGEFQKCREVGRKGTKTSVPRSDQDQLRQTVQPRRNLFGPQRPQQQQVKHEAFEAQLVSSSVLQPHLQLNNNNGAENDIPKAYAGQEHKDRHLCADFKCAVNQNHIKTENTFTCAFGEDQDYYERMPKAEKEWEAPKSSFCMPLLLPTFSELQDAEIGESNPNTKCKNSFTANSSNAGDCDHSRCHSVAQYPMFEVNRMATASMERITERKFTYASKVHAERIVASQHIYFFCSSCDLASEPALSVSLTSFSGDKKENEIFHAETFSAASVTCFSMCAFSDNDDGKVCAQTRDLPASLLEDDQIRSVRSRRSDAHAYVARDVKYSASLWSPGNDLEIDQFGVKGVSENQERNTCTNYMLNNNYRNCSRNDDGHSENIIARESSSPKRQGPSQERPCFFRPANVFVSLSGCNFSPLQPHCSFRSLQLGSLVGEDCDEEQKRAGQQQLHTGRLGNEPPQHHHHARFDDSAGASERFYCISPLSSSVSRRT